MDRGEIDVKAIIVDDERLALKKLENLLTESSEKDIQFEEIRTFQDPQEAIEAVRNETFHLAFLDIEMPEINGFELAEKLMMIQPHLHIIFVTAYQEYAVKAFEMNALDYLLKPVHVRRLTVTMQRVVKSMVSAPVDHSARNQETICCLQNLHYIDRQGEVQFFPWKTLKAQELFAYLVMNRNKTVSKQTLIDLLWPEYDTVRSTTQLHTAIYQIRKIIKNLGLDLEIKYKDERYRLVWGDIKLDVEEWENAVRDAPPIDSHTLRTHLSIMAKYPGGFLEEHSYLWAEYEQERLQMIWLSHASEIAEWYQSTEQFTEAILLYQQIREKLPGMEDGYFGLMKLYAMTNHPREVTKQYQILTEKLKEEFDVAPSKELEQWYQHWKQGRDAR